MGEGRAADMTLAASSAWTDDVRRSAAVAGEGRGDSTVRGLRRAPKPQSSVDGRWGPNRAKIALRAILARLYIKGGLSR